MKPARPIQREEGPQRRGAATSQKTKQIPPVRPIVVVRRHPSPPRFSSQLLDSRTAHTTQSMRRGKEVVKCVVPNGKPQGGRPPPAAPGSSSSFLRGAKAALPSRAPRISTTVGAAVVTNRVRSGHLGGGGANSSINGTKRKVDDALRRPGSSSFVICPPPSQSTFPMGNNRFTAPLVRRSKIPVSKSPPFAAGSRTRSAKPSRCITTSTTSPESTTKMMTGRDQRNGRLHPTQEASFLPPHSYPQASLALSAPASASQPPPPLTSSLNAEPPHCGSSRRETGEERNEEEEGRGVCLRPEEEAPSVVTTPLPQPPFSTPTEQQRCASEDPNDETPMDALSTLLARVSLDHQNLAPPPEPIGNDTSNRHISGEMSRKMISSTSASSVSMDWATPRVRKLTPTLTSHTVSQLRSTAPRGHLRRSTAVDELRTPPAPLRRARGGRILAGIRQNDPAVIEEAIIDREDPNDLLHIPMTYPRPGGALRNPSTRGGNNVALPPLLVAVRNSGFRVVKKLLQTGASVNAVDHVGRNCLHILLLSEDDLPPELCLYERPLASTPFRPKPIPSSRSPHASRPPRPRRTLSRESEEERQHRYRKTAEVLCSYNLNIERADSTGKTVLDLAYSWLPIGKRQAQLRCRLQNASSVYAYDALSQEDQRVISIFVPHEVIYAVLAHENKLKLDALAPVVGINLVESSKARTKVIRRRSKQKFCSVCGGWIRTASSRVTPTSLPLKRLDATPPFVLNVTPPFATVSRVSSGTPSFPHHTNSVRYSSGVPSTVLRTQRRSSAHRSALLRKRTSRELLLPPDCGALAEILLLSGSPSQLGHPALSGLWEFLGAKFRSRATPAASPSCSILPSCPIVVEEGRTPSISPCHCH